MRIGILTNEYPPHVYGGAGVHVEYLTRELARLDDGAHSVHVMCFGDQAERRGSLEVHGIEAPVAISGQDARHEKFFDTILRNLVMSGRATALDIVHCHTWYSHFAGCLVKNLQNVPLALTTHSLEPHRPWKVEQLGTAYNASTFVERTAYQSADGVVAVSAAMKRDVRSLYGVPDDRIRIIHNGIDLQQYRPAPDPELLASLGIDPDVPYVLFVGRITRQKGIIHLVNAIRHIRAGVQLVL
jgi:alpha-maltose-1-phosphate synthase